MENNKKKQLIISIIGVIVLLIIVGGISYAMYTFTGTGSKENVITSGAVSIDYAEQTNITLTNEYPKSDTLGINSTEQNSTMQFTVSANITGTQTINYAIGFDSIVEGSTLTDSYVKVYLTKGSNVATNFELNTGKTINSFRTSYIDGIMDSYAILTDSFNQTTSHTYTLKAWVADNYKLPTTYSGTCSDTEYTTPDECRSHSETWTDTTTGVHGNTTTSETFKFKIKVVATDAAIEIADNSVLPNLDTSGANVPDLPSNMIPVYYDSTNDVWRKADVNNTDSNYRWYSYESSGSYKGMWANAVTVTETNRQTYLNAALGTAIPMSDINTMFVWIPRFNAVTPSNYNGGTAAAPGAINVTFVDTNTPSIDAFWWDENNNGTQDSGEQKSGYWAGKFETSHSTLTSSTTNNNLGCSNETCSNANGIIIKPNVTSLRYNNVSNFFFASRSMEQANNSFGFVSSEVDTHTLKNSEWGAAVYLTQSIYGRCTSATSCTEVAINDNSSYITGGTTYKTNTNQSTTGTIYGIYDMSGGAFEYVMGNYNNTTSSSGFASTWFASNTKYYNKYIASSYTGHALTETAGWYSDNADFVDSSVPWFLRGGSYGNGSNAGVFRFNYYFGSAYSSFGSRLSIAK